MSNAHVLACKECETAVVVEYSPKLDAYRDADDSDHNCAACGCTRFMYFGGLSR